MRFPLITTLVCIVSALSVSAEIRIHGEIDGDVLTVAIENNSSNDARIVIPNRDPWRKYSPFLFEFLATTGPIEINGRDRWNQSFMVSQIIPREMISVDLASSDLMAGNSIVLKYSLSDLIPKQIQENREVYGFRLHWNPIYFLSDDERPVSDLILLPMPKLSLR